MARLNDQRLVTVSIMLATVMQVLDKGFRTGDIMQADMQVVGTSAMGDAVLQALDELGN